MAKPKPSWVCQYRKDYEQTWMVKDDLTMYEAVKMAGDVIQQNEDLAFAYDRNVPLNQQVFIRSERF